MGSFFPHATLLDWPFDEHKGSAPTVPHRCLMDGLNTLEAPPRIFTREAKEKIANVLLGEVTDAAA
jgi:hypothetical protein